MGRGVSEFRGFDDRGNLRFYRGKIVNKICLLFRQIYRTYLILKVNKITFLV